jgi:hypothetical protein
MPSHTICSTVAKTAGTFSVVEKEWKAVRTADEEAHAPDPSASLQLYMTRQVVHMASLDLDESRVS